MAKPKTAPAPKTARKVSWANSVTGVSGTHPLWIIVLASLWMAFFGNLALWQELALNTPLLVWRNALSVLSFAVTVAALTGAVLSLLAWRWTLKPLVAVLMLITAVSTYFMLYYRVVMDAPALSNLAQTDLRELHDWFSVPMVLFVIFLALLPAAWLLNRPLQRMNLASQAAFNAIAFASFLTVALATGWTVHPQVRSADAEHPDWRHLVNPLNTVAALAYWAVQPPARPGASTQAIGQDVARGPSYHSHYKPALLLLIVGESARSDHFSLNGYKRVTNPKLAQEDVVSFRQVVACNTSTAAALPCMFSHLGKDQFERRGVAYQNLLDVLQTAGLGVLWLENQYGCAGVCTRVAQFDTSRLTVEGLCTSGECQDEVMLLNLTERLAALPEAQRNNGIVVVMHAMGSHGPAYDSRSVEAYKRFKPECNTNLLQDCSHESVVNAYDNSLVYTDHLVSESIQWLKGQSSKFTTSLMYVSDHGQSLGENRQYLHGAPVGTAPAAQKNVPWIAWLSATQQARGRISLPCMKTHLNDPLSHDNLFHSVLGLLDIRTQIYNKELDVFAVCSK
jgi:lipid A ethanolaminephosphotransferase